MHQMKSWLVAVLLVPVASFVAGCDSGPRPPDVQIVDPNRPVATVNWSLTDLQKVCDECFTQLSQHVARTSGGQQPRVMLSRIENHTNEIIDTSFIGQKIMTAMEATNQFVMIDAQAREDIAGEYQYQQSGYVDPSKAKGPGHQEAAEYMLRGELTEIQNAKGWSEVKSYNLTMRLTNIETGVKHQWESQITKVINR